jgi:hypothetical protein
MKAHKAEILAVLATRKTSARLLDVATRWPADWRELWEERAGIAEYDGNMSRGEAEWHACIELARMVERGGR